MNVVIVNEHPPYPPNGGGRIRALNLMLRLAPRHRITCICRTPADADEAGLAQRYLAEHGIDCIYAGDPPLPRKGPRFYAALARNLLSPQPYAVTSHNCPKLRRAIADHAASKPVDLWQFEWLAYADAVNGPAPRLVVAHDVVSTIWRRYHENETNPLKRWFIRGQWRKFERYERRILAGATRIVAVSDEDASIIRTRYGARDVDVVDNGIDRACFETIQPRRNPATILYLGNMETGPNRDAAAFLLDRIFPRVQAVVPEARLIIAGKNPPEWIGGRASAMANVEVQANIPDVRPLLAAAGVMAVPIRIGSGSRLKILEALACGLPVISTRIGAEGLDLRPDQHLTIADGEIDFAHALAQCLRNPEPALAMASAGRRVVLERYDWDVLADRLEQVWHKCLQSPPVPPRQPAQLCERKS
jgi:polysaccharide biosynthesis protein PslH